MSRGGAHARDEAHVLRMVERRRRMAGAYGGKAYDPTALFASYSAAGLYIPNFDDFSKLFQDSAGTTPVTAAGDPIGKVTDSGPTGTSIVQATGGSRGTLRLVGNRHVWRGDGVDDNLLTNLTPGVATTIIMGLTMNADTDAAIGARDASALTRILAGTSFAANIGKWSGTVAGQDSGTIVGGSDIRAAPGVGTLRYDGSNVTLMWRAAGGAVSTLYGPSAQSGAPQTTVPFRLGSNNNNGAVAIPMDGDMYSAFVIKAALTDGEIASVVNVLAL